ncbi:MAG: VWA domain-containing protein [Deltaproteobacteria bacterium]|nr:VWA domain-containing protein [Deltaproteobacteria bacterium]
MSAELKLDLRPDFEVISGGRTVMHVVGKVEAAGGNSERPALDVVFVLDVSPSMSGEPSRQVARSTERMIELLGKQDRIGVVAFSSRAQVVSELVQVAGASRRELIDRVRQLGVFGSGTNLEAGLSKGMRMFSSGDARRLLVLLSDGQPNQGVKSPEGLAQLTRRSRPAVTVATLGFGEHHDERSLQAIADAGSGTYGFIRDPALCQGELASALGSAVDLVARGLTLDLEAGCGVEILEVLGGDRPQGAGRSVPFVDRVARAIRGSGLERVGLRDLAGGASQRLTVRLAVNEPVGAKAEVLRARLAYVDTMGQQRLVCAAAEVTIASVAGPLVLSVARDVVLSKAEADRRAAAALADEGRPMEAAGLLRVNTAMIPQLPGFARNDGSDLAELFEQLVDDIAVYEECPDEEALRMYRRGQRMDEGGRLAAGGRDESSLGAAMERDARGPIPEAYLVELGSGARTALALKSKHVIGRSRTCDVCVPSARVSRQHAALVAQDGVWFLEDYGSANGVVVNGRKVSAAALTSGAHIVVGDFEYRIDYGARSNDVPSSDRPRV